MTARRARVYDDPEWVYTKREATDIRVLFAKVREEMKQQQAKESTVRPIRRSKP